MLDINGAARSVASTATNIFLASMNINATLAMTKASWNVAIRGAYALLEPLIHADYYTYQEVDTYNAMMNTNLSIAWQMYNLHQHPTGLLWAFATYQDVVWSAPQMVDIPQEVFIPKISRPIEITQVASAALADVANDVEFGAITTELIEVYSYSPVIGLI